MVVNDFRLGIKGGDVANDFRMLVGGAGDMHFDVGIGDRHLHGDRQRMQNLMRLRNIREAYPHQCAGPGILSGVVARKRRTKKICVPSITIRSEEHTSELQSLMRISYAVFCLKKKKQKNN